VERRGSVIQLTSVANLLGGDERMTSTKPPNEVG
jgi:hypothetical protein